MGGDTASTLRLGTVYPEFRRVSRCVEEPGAGNRQARVCGGPGGATRRAIPSAVSLPVASADQFRSMMRDDAQARLVAYADLSNRGRSEAVERQSVAMQGTL